MSRINRPHSLIVLLLLVGILPNFALAEVTRWVRFNDSGVPRYGLIEGERVQVVEGAPWDAYRRTGRDLALDSLILLTPTDPQIVLGAAFNYRSHLGDVPAPTEPQLFWKGAECLIAQGQTILLPIDATEAHFEAELVVVLGQTLHNATLIEAEQAILGYTCGNDISERNWQKSDMQWWRAKSTRTFGPIGPYLVTGLTWKDLRVRGWHNGKIAQEESASDMIFSPAELLQKASQYITLEPGDLLFTGAPGNTRALKNGDLFEVDIERIGRLSNPVQVEPTGK